MPETEAGWLVGEKRACSQNRPFQAPPAPLAAGLGPGRRARGGQSWKGEVEASAGRGYPQQEPPSPCISFPASPAGHQAAPNSQSGPGLVPSLLCASLSFPARRTTSEWLLKASRTPTKPGWPATGSPSRAAVSPGAGAQGQAEETEGARRADDPAAAWQSRAAPHALVHRPCD